MEQENKQQGSRQGKDDQAPSLDPEQEYIQRGPGVALMVQLFCFQEQYEMRSTSVDYLALACMLPFCSFLRSVDLLPAVFQLFPVGQIFFCAMKHQWLIGFSSLLTPIQDHDYLVLAQPHAVPEFPLLQHFSVSLCHGCREWCMVSGRWGWIISKGKQCHELQQSVCTIALLP